MLWSGWKRPGLAVLTPTRWLLDAIPQAGRGFSWLFPTTVVVTDGGSWLDGVWGTPSYTPVVLVVARDRSPVMGTPPLSLVPICCFPSRFRNLHFDLLICPSYLFLPNSKYLGTFLDGVSMSCSWRFTRGMYGLARGKQCCLKAWQTSARPVLVSCWLQRTTFSLTRAWWLHYTFIYTHHFYNTRWIFFLALKFVFMYMQAIRGCMHACINNSHHGREKLMKLFAYFVLYISRGASHSCV